MSKSVICKECPGKVMMDNSGSGTIATDTSVSSSGAPGYLKADSYLVVFGTYNYSHVDILEDATNQAMYLLQLYKQPQLIDTAMKYRNLETLMKVLESHPKARIGWKVEHSPRVSTPWSLRSSLSKAMEGSIAVNKEQESNDAALQARVTPTNGQAEKMLNGKSMYDGITFLKDNVPREKIFRILLHNYCGKKSYLEFQRLVEQEFGPSMPIGICNVSAEQLEDMIKPVNTPNHCGEKSTLDPYEDQKARIDWVQNEYHPFLQTSVPEICRKNGIRFEAHSVMTKVEKYSDSFERIGLSCDLPLNKAVDLALKYSLKQGSVCFTTANFKHLQRDLSSLLHPETDEQDDILLTAMSQFSSFMRVVRYKGAKTEVNTDWITTCDSEQFRNEILPKVKRDIAAFEEGKTPSDLCIHIPKNSGQGAKAHQLLAEMLYGEDVQSQMIELREKIELKMERNKILGKKITDEELMIRLEARWNCKLDVILKKMRHAVNKEKSNQRMFSKKAAKPVQAVQQPEALPMDSYPEASEFEDLIHFIQNGGTAEIQNELPVNIRFKYGTVNSDGRLDLCKQGFRLAFADSCDAVIQDGRRIPVNIRFKYGTINNDGRLDLCKQGFRNAFHASCEAVVQDKQENGSKTTEPLIKHYLIGNNRIAEDGEVPGEGDRRVKALANMIRNRPDTITWYLAGNSIDHEQIKYVANALEQSKAKNIWFKMNPVKTGSYHLGKLIMRNKHIELLDLFNCGLCNNGLAAFAEGLADGALENSNPYSNLRHLYISINAIDSTTSLIQALSFLPNLESLFIGVNPFSDTGLKEIASAFIDVIPCHKVLKRLNLGSMGLTDVSLPQIEKIVLACPNLVSLELDSYKSTNYFCQPHNRFDVSNVKTCMQLVKIAQGLLQNARNAGTPSMQYLGLQHALVVGSGSGARKVATAQAKSILDDLIHNQLHRETGINVNGITNLFCLNREKTCHFDRDDSLDDETSNHFKSIEEGKIGKKLEADKVSINKVTAGGIFIAKDITKEDLIPLRHPWPALDYIKSIYRNTMKV